VLLDVTAGFDEAVIDMLNGGEVYLTGEQPNPNRYRIALLKHGYLAACIRFGIPQGEIADEIRRDLLAARDAPNREAVPQSQLALSLTVLRADDPTSLVLPPVMWAVAREGSTSYEGVLLAGRAFVSWPPRPAPNQTVVTPSQVRITLHVGESIGGTIASVDGS
jgi:hypothetical protein